MKTSSKPESKEKAPWYRNHDYYLSVASEYLSKLPRFYLSSGQALEIEAASEFNSVRLVFESNLIEGAGLPSEGETRKVIEDHFPKLPRRFNVSAPFFEVGGGFEKLLSERQLLKLIEETGLARKDVIPSISFAGKPRRYREVLQHFDAVFLALFSAFNWLRESIIATERGRSYEKHEKSEKRKELSSRALELLGKERIRRRKLLTHTSIKKLHRVMAHGLLPSDSQVKAGQYRTDSRAVGWEIQFPSPDLVKDSIDEFIVQSDRLLRETLSKRSCEAVFEAAAEISYHFVRIHPFPDFNGRLSRIIMNMVLATGGCDIPIALHGNKKGRKRYFTALRHANRGNLQSLTTLIAMRFIETLEEVDDNLRLAGKPTIWDYSKDDKAVKSGVKRDHRGERA